MPRKPSTAPVPPCADCGTPDGHVSPWGRPVRCTGRPYGFDGQLCTRCESRHRKIARARARREAERRYQSSVLAAGSPARAAILKRLQAKFRASLLAELRGIEERKAEIRAEKVAQPEYPLLLPLRVYGRPASAIAEARKAAAS
jgi:hypothetical protein